MSPPDKFHPPPQKPGPYIPPHTAPRFPVKPHPAYEDDDDGGDTEDSPFGKALKIIFILAGIAGIIGLIYLQPKKQALVCERTYQSQGSPLTSFGSCRRE